MLAQVRGLHSDESAEATCPQQELWPTAAPADAQLTTNVASGVEVGHLLRCAWRVAADIVAGATMPPRWSFPDICEGNSRVRPSVSPYPVIAVSIGHAVRVTRCDRFCSGPLLVGLVGQNNRRAFCRKQEL